MTADEQFDLIAVLAVVMRREGLDSVKVTYEELSAEPIQLLVERGEDDSIRVSLADHLTEPMKEHLQKAADTSGKPVTVTFPGSGGKNNKGMN